MKGGADLRIIHPRVNREAVDLAREILRAVESGEVTAIAYAVVERGGVVGTAFSALDNYHSLNSGVATLAARLASL